MYAIYLEKYKSWCVFRDCPNGLNSTLVESGFETRESAEKFIESTQGK